MTDSSKSISVLTMNTAAFTVCFACWMLNGVLVTFLVDHDVFQWTETQIGWLIGIPVLTGSIMRLPVGILTDKYGGRRVFTVLMAVSAVPMFALSYANTYGGFVLASLGFGLSGASFAVGIAYTTLWFSKDRQGTALGIFGAGNAGSAITSMGAPPLLMRLTDGGAFMDGWRTLPKLYATVLILTAIAFYFLTFERKVEGHATGLSARLAPLRHMRVWRFCLYYFLVFGGFVALSQWLIPYYVNAYQMSVVTAGLMAAIFSLPSGVIRALGGWLSDRFGARRVMYWVLGTCLAGCVLLIVPRMDVELPGKGIMAARAGVVTAVRSDEIEVDGRKYGLRVPPAGWSNPASGDTLLLPARAFWQTPVVAAGDKVAKKQLLAAGNTHIYFQANVWIFTGLVFVVGIMMGIGKAAVYRHIPDYFPKDVGVVGGIVGVIGGLGGFVCPIIFGNLLERTGVWTTCWMFLAVLALVSLIWMHIVVQQMMHRHAPELHRRIEHHPASPHPERMAS